MTTPGDVLRQARGSRVVRAAATVVVVVGLVLAGYLFNDRITGQDKTLTSTQAILASTCGSASFAELERQGLVEECRLAQKGDLVDAIPDADLPEVDAKPAEVQTDVVKDDPNSTPADISPAPGVTSEQVSAVVEPAVQDAVQAYFASNPLPTTAGYQRAIRRATVQYLSANPPDPGPAPTDGQVEDAVRVVLAANPPADGQDGTNGTNGLDGVNGRGVASASVDGCDVVFGFTDGTTQRVGPLCGDRGPQGEDATDQQVAQAVAAYCTANGACVGPAGVVRTEDNCQPADGEFVTDVSITGPVGDPATITLSCTTAPGGLLTP